MRCEQQNRVRKRDSFCFMQEIQELQATTARLEQSVLAEKMRADTAEAECRILHDQLHTERARSTDPDACRGQDSVHHDDSADLHDESALWKELEAARREAAVAKARAAEARAGTDSAAAQLEEAKGAFDAFQSNLQTALSDPDHRLAEASPQSVLLRVQRLLEDNAALKEQLSTTRSKAMEEQLTAVKVRLASMQLNRVVIFTWLGLTDPPSQCSETDAVA
jgi:hypothetical protein